MLSPTVLADAMKLAAAEARKWLGATYPNPPVGAVALDAAGDVLAVAAHQKAGEAHAEAALLAQCRAENLLERIDTLVVTLEPCNHQGRTPPCCAAIIEAGVKHVVIGALDPNPNVRGGGAAWLRSAGIKITENVEETVCQQLIYAFAYSVTHGMPWLTVKRAFNEHGTMFPPPGQNTFTSDASLVLAHQLRKRAGAILTGSGTILADDPRFMVVNVPDYRERTRVLAILDRRRRVPESWLKDAWKRKLVPIVYEDLGEAIADLGRREVRDVLVEAGPVLSQAVMDSGFWTMDVRIQKSDPDETSVHFNKSVPLPFSPGDWRWDYMLPSNVERELRPEDCCS